MGTRDDRAQAVLYGKGCVLLHDLAETMGREAFAGLITRANDEAVKTTDELLAVLAKMAGSEVARGFAVKLGELAR